MFLIFGSPSWFPFFATSLSSPSWFLVLALRLGSLSYLVSLCSFHALAPFLGSLSLLPVVFTYLHSLCYPPALVPRIRSLSSFSISIPRLGYLSKLPVLVPCLRSLKLLQIGSNGGRASDPHVPEWSVRDMHAKYLKRRNNHHKTQHLRSLSFPPVLLFIANVEAATSHMKYATALIAPAQHSHRLKQPTQRMR